jgi:hypothetical protein
VKKAEKKELTLEVIGWYLDNIQEKLDDIKARKANFLDVTGDFHLVEEMDRLNKVLKTRILLLKRVLKVE